MEHLEHITEEDLTAYRKRELTPAEILNLQRHIAGCDVCRQKLAQILNSETTFSAVQNAFASNSLDLEPEHLTSEQLMLWIDEKLDPVELEIAESHFAICPECQKDLADLKQYQLIAAAPPILPKKSAETFAKSFWLKIFIFDSIGAFAPIAAALLITILLGAWFLLRNNQNEIAQTNINKIIPTPSPAIANGNNSPNVNVSPENLQFPTVSPPPENSLNNAPQLALNDGQITVDEGSGNIKGLENLSPQTQRAIRQSLQTGRVPVSDAAKSLGGESGGILMGGGNEDAGVPFALQTPIGKVVKESKPLLRWKSLKDAVSYSVTIVDDKFRVAAESGKLTATSWQPSKPLPRGINYSWQVTATDANGSETVSPSSPAPQARFRVVEQTTIDEINKLENSPTRSHLTLGVLYAQSGLKQEARREFETLAKENPKSTLARKLLKSVR